MTEFNEISGSVCDPLMFEKEIEPTHMCFEQITKKEFSVMYWGQFPGTYDLWTRANDLRKRLALGFESDLALLAWMRKRDALVKDIKALNIK